MTTSGEDHPTRASDIRVIGYLTVDVNARQAAVHGNPIPLTRVEFDLIEALTEHPGWVCESPQLAERIGRYDAASLKALSVHVCHLRRKIASANGGGHGIETVRGVGYRLRPDSGDQTSEYPQVQDRSLTNHAPLVVEQEASAPTVPPSQPGWEALTTIQLRIAGEAARRRDIGGALEALEATLEFLDVVPEGARDERWWDLKIDTLVERMNVLQWAGRPDVIVLAGAELLGDLEERGTPANQTDFHRSVAIAHLLLDGWIAGEQALSHAKIQFDRSRSLEAPARAIAEAFYGAVLRMAGQLRPARQHLTDALAEARSAATLEPQLLALGNLGLVAIAEENGAEAGSCGRQLLSAAGDGRHPDNVGGGHALLSWEAWLSGEADEAVRESKQAFREWEDCAPFPYQWIALLPAASCALASGRTDEAVDHVRDLLAPMQQRLVGTKRDLALAAVSAAEGGDEAQTRCALEAFITACRSAGCT